MALMKSEVQESRWMLVFWDNGDQRLITFTMPKKTCTILELLDRLKIQVDVNSKVEFIESKGSVIHHIVKMGRYAGADITNMIRAAEHHVLNHQQIKVEK
jgi:hypothetical protein